MISSTTSKHFDIFSSLTGGCSEGLEDAFRRASCLKKNLNASRPSEHLPVRGENMSKRLIVGGIIIGCKDKTSSWHLIGFPDRW